MANELVQFHPEYNPYPDIIILEEHNPTLRSPYSPVDLFFYQTRETLNDPDTFRNFVKNAESLFRASREYKAYKSYLIESIGLDRCAILGNVTVEDADIELHHNILGLFDICVLIATHIVNTVGYITTFDLVQLLIQEHYANNIGITFLSKTAHQIYTNDPDGYLPPSCTYGAWFNLLGKYQYGITFDIAYKVIKYIRKYQNEMPSTVKLPQQEEVLSWAAYNTYGEPLSNLGTIMDMPVKQNNQIGESEYEYIY